MTRPDHPIPAHDGEALERLTTDAVARVDLWANYEFTYADTVAVNSPLASFTAGDLRMILDLIATQADRIGELEAASRPFVEIAKDWRIEGTFWTDEKILTSINPPITIGQVRRLAALLTKGQSHAD